MSLVVTPSDLDSLLELSDTIDSTRATLLIELAMELCSSVVDPLPDNARAVVLTVAARAYTNPAGVTSQTAGPESVAYGSTSIGIYLTKADVVTLNRLAGGSGAFDIETLPATALNTVPYSWDIDLSSAEPGLLESIDDSE